MNIKGATSNNVLEGGDELIRRRKKLLEGGDELIRRSLEKKKRRTKPRPTSCK
jgi:hypothetical protein